MGLSTFVPIPAFRPSHCLFPRISNAASPRQVIIYDHRLAVWLSNEKANLEGLEEADNLTEVLLFKQAIALGWDCPRAAVLLIFRKLQSNEFTIQTVGRILRMPEQKFYNNELLNVGYVYTDISKEHITIVSEDLDYLNKDTIQAVRREGLSNVALQSYYSIYKSGDRNRLGPDFKKVLMDCFVRDWLLDYQPTCFSFEEMRGEEEPVANNGAESSTSRNRQIAESKIRLDVKNVNVEIPVDVVFQNELGVIDVGERRKFARSVGEIQRIYIYYCRSLLGKFEKAHSTDVLAGYLLAVMEELFELYDTEAKKVILYHANKPKFTEIITKALGQYEQILQERKKIAQERAFETYLWEVPAERLYKESTHRIQQKVEDHALLPFIELRDVSTPEEHFRDFLESNKEYIDWWYKNGDDGKQHYSIPYTKADGTKSLFYVDFIIKMKNGQVFLFDTKTEESDPEAPNKHNALLAYMQAPEQMEQHLQGGVIVEQYGVWRYSPVEIEDSKNISNWKGFFPDQYGVKKPKHFY